MYQGPGIYNHHSGKTYHVVGLGVNKDTEEEIVIYCRKTGDDKVLWFSRTPQSFNTQSIQIVNPQEHDEEIVPKFQRRHSDIPFSFP